MSENPLKVMFLDDDVFIRKIYKDRLTAAGFDVKVAASGGEAIDLAKNFPFDAMILDMVMPDMTGIEVIKSIRNIANHAKTKLIVFSALGQEKTIEEAKQAGADEFLVKDKVMPSDLVAKINEIVANKK